MSTKVFKYILDLVANTSKSVTAIKGMTNQLNRAERQAKQLNTVNQKAVGIFKNLAGVMGVAFGVGAVVSFAKASLAAYDVQAKAERNLLVALKGRKDVQQRLIMQAQALQGKTLFGDEETIKAQALIAAFVKEEDQIKKVIPLVQDLATAKGMDLAAAADLVSKTLGSTTNAMSRYGIEVEGAVGSNERLQSLIGSLTAAFGGQAEAAAAAGAGGITQLTNAIGDLKEEVGKLIVTGDGFSKWIQGSIKEVQDWSTIIGDENRSGFKNWMLFLGGSTDRWHEVAESIRKAKAANDETTTSITKIAGVIDTTYIPAIYGLTKANEEATGRYRMLSEIAQDYTEKTKKQATTYADLKSQIAAKTAELEKADITDKAYIQTIYAEIKALNKKKEAFEALSVVKQVTPRVEKMDKLGTIGDVQLAGGGVDIPVQLNLKEMQSQMPVFQANMEAMRQEQQKLIEKQKVVQAALTDGFAEIGSSIVNSLGLAKDGFEGFLGKMLETATQLIAMYLAQSIAASVSNSAQSAAATGPAAVFTQPAFMATLIGGVLGAFAAIPKFASGAIAYGPTVGMIGEYPGASSNPEVIAPLDKLKGMLAGSGGGRDRFFIPTTRIRKGDIYISYKEAEKEFAMRT